MDPGRFGRVNSNPSKESDVHSLAMTTYEVWHPLPFPHLRAWLRTPHNYQVLTEIQPYTGNRADGKIITLITAGTRPPRTKDGVAGFWLTDLIWGTMESCWSEDPSERLSINEVYDTFSRSAEDMANLVPENGE